MASITLHNPAETHRFGQALAATLTRGSVVALCGDLGAGKTHLAKGIADGLGCNPEEVTSPTFTLVHEYLGFTIPLYHFDLYRLETEDEVLRLGWDEYLTSGIALVEWADKFPALFPTDTRWLHLQVGEGDARTLTER